MAVSGIIYPPKEELYKSHLPKIQDDRLPHVFAVGAAAEKPDEFQGLIGPLNIPAPALILTGSDPFGHTGIPAAHPSPRYDLPTG